MCLGLPKGFNRCGYEVDGDSMFKSTGRLLIRLWPKGTDPHYDKFNVPVWAMEKDGFLYVRTYMPRTNKGCTDVIEGGTITEFCPDAIDVGEFYDEID